MTIDFASNEIIIFRRNLLALAANEAVCMEEGRSPEDYIFPLWKHLSAFSTTA
jgi:hypothetical protein